MDIKLFKSVLWKCIVCCLIFLCINHFLSWLVLGNTFYTAFDHVHGVAARQNQTLKNSSERICPIDRGLNMSIEDKWQILNKFSSNKFYAFSAYIDRLHGSSQMKERRRKYVNPPVVRLVGTTLIKNATKTYCKLFYPSGKSVIIPSINSPIRDSHRKKYSAFWYVCPLDNETEGLPCAVSMLTHPNDVPFIILPIHDNELDMTRNPTAQYEFAVCVKPIYDYDEPLRFIEFVELQQILGVTHFTFYLHGASNNIKKLLQYYTSRGIFYVLPWHIDLKSRVEVWTENIFAALNDCMLRYRYRAKYVLMIDLDEYIIPHVHSNLTTMLSSIHTTNKQASFVFKNSFFYLEWPANSSKTWPVQLLALTKTKRATKFFAHNLRSKYIINPLGVFEAGNHFVWEHIAGYHEVPVGEEIGFSHHYRTCEYKVEDCVKQPSTQDTTMHRFANTLIPRVQHVIKDLQLDGL